MKFLYEYRTSDNVRHSGVIVAPDREGAFAALKEKGIRPGCVVEAPGFFNKLFGKGKRWIAIGVLGGLVVAALVVIRSNNQAIERAQSVFESPVRRQVIGDAAIIEKGIRTGWADVFAEDGERFLASFAIPGVPAGQRNTSEKAIVDALSRSIQIEESDGMEARQIKSMVEGMKNELRRFLSKGGSVMQYGNRLVERQEQELGYYNRAKHELDEAVKSGMNKTELNALWEDRNARLRKMGVKLVQMPDGE